MIIDPETGRFFYISKKQSGGNNRRNERMFWFYKEIRPGGHMILIHGTIMPEASKYYRSVYISALFCEVKRVQCQRDYTADS